MNILAMMNLKLEQYSSHLMMAKWWILMATSFRNTSLDHPVNGTNQLPVELELAGQYHLYTHTGIQSPQ